MSNMMLVSIINLSSDPCIGGCEGNSDKNRSIYFGESEGCYVRSNSRYPPSPWGRRDGFLTKDKLIFLNKRGVNTHE
jgi:hypothetical protein